MGIRDSTYRYCDSTWPPPKGSRSGTIMELTPRRERLSESQASTNIPASWISQAYRPIRVFQNRSTSKMPQGPYSQRSTQLTAHNARMPSTFHTGFQPSSRIFRASSPRNNVKNWLFRDRSKARQHCTRSKGISKTTAKSSTPAASLLKSWVFRKASTSKKAKMGKANIQSTFAREKLTVTPHHLRRSR